MRILGIDPGEDVGLSLLNTVTEEDRSWQYRVEDVEVFPPHITLYEVIRDIYPDVIICEDFYHIPRYMKLNMITSELIGVVKLYAQEEDIKLVMQNRGMKQGWPDQKLKMLGLFQPGEDFEDAMDALRHRLVYQERYGMIDWSKLKPQD